MTEMPPANASPSKQPQAQGCGCITFIWFGFLLFMTVGGIGIATEGDISALAVVVVLGLPTVWIARVFDKGKVRQVLTSLILLALAVFWVYSMTPAGKAAKARYQRRQQAEKQKEVAEKAAGQSQPSPKARPVASERSETPRPAATPAPPKQVAIIADLAGLVGKSKQDTQRQLQKFRHVDTVRLTDPDDDPPGGRYVSYSAGDEMKRIVVKETADGKCIKAWVENQEDAGLGVPLKDAPKLLAKWGMGSLPPPYKEAPAGTHWRIVRNGRQLHVIAVSAEVGGPIWQVQVRDADE